MVRFKESAKPIYEKWESIYCEENDRLGGNSENGEFVDGWCIIENDDFIKTLDDVVGLYIFGYGEDALGTIDEWIERYGEEDRCFKFKLIDVMHEMEKYFEWQ